MAMRQGWGGKPADDSYEWPMDEHGMNTDALAELMARDTADAKKECGGGTIYKGDTFPERFRGVFEALERAFVRRRLGRQRVVQDGEVVTRLRTAPHAAPLAGKVVDRGGEHFRTRVTPFARAESSRLGMWRFGARSV
jgi:hypothetical protein